MCDMYVLSLPDVSHVFPEFPAPDLGSALLQESVTPHDVKALQLVYRRHCEVTPYLARPIPTCSSQAPLPDQGPISPPSTGPSPGHRLCPLSLISPFGDLRKSHRFPAHQACDWAYPLTGRSAPRPP